MAQYRPQSRFQSQVCVTMENFKVLAYVDEKHVIILGEVSGQLSQLSFRSV